MILILIAIQLLSCSTSKQVVKTENEGVKNKADFINEGYEFGTVHYNENSLCEFTIMLKATGFHLDPVNFNDDGFNTFRVQGKNVILKYRLLRRANRCDTIQPVELTDIRFIE